MRLGAWWIVALAWVLAMVLIAMGSDPLQPADPGAPPPASPPPPDPLRVEVFYYAWYGNATVDGAWLHWDQGGHVPPRDIASSFYPSRGPYSSGDMGTLDQQMRWIQASGAGVLVYSWWGAGGIEDQRLPTVLGEASRYHLRVAIHLEPGPYFTSPAATVAAADGLLHRYGSNPAFVNRFHVFQATRFPLATWASALAAPHRAKLLAQTTDGSWMDTFDGLYQYDGSVRLSTASWAALASRARSLGKVFIPNVAPGYDESRAAGRAYLTVDRANGSRYDALWRAALEANPQAVAITSFNEWHEGTQIEPAVPMAIPGYTYRDYGTLPPDYYVTRTAFWAAQLASA